MRTPTPLPTLPLQLMLTLPCWLNSPFAWGCANGASPNSKNKNPAANANLQSQKLERALAEEAKNRAADFLSGVLRYLEAPYTRNVTEPPCIWQRGNARLLDYGLSALSLRERGGVSRGEGISSQATPSPGASRHPLPEGEGNIVLFIPSLINRYYILDLEEERSLLRFLAGEGLHPLVLDWGEPGEFEKNFGCGDYITEILNPAIDFLAKASGKPIALAGYCMGGNLALAAAQLKPKQVNALALLATPWDFHCKEFKPFVVGKEWLPMIKKHIAAQEQLPADIIQSLFYMTDPWVFEQKFRRFSGLAEGSRATRDFIALEHWVNDGVPMTANVARDCLIGWAQENILMGGLVAPKRSEGGWRVADRVIDPKKIKIPTYIALPQSDHVVPLSCALPLADNIRQAKISRPSSGHVGMIVGTKAKKELWQPLAEWMRCNAA